MRSDIFLVGPNLPPPPSTLQRPARPPRSGHDAMFESNSAERISRLIMKFGARPATASFTSYVGPLLQAPGIVRDVETPAPLPRPAQQPTWATPALAAPQLPAGSPPSSGPSPAGRDSTPSFQRLQPAQQQLNAIWEAVHEQQRRQQEHRRATSEREQLLVAKERILEDSAARTQRHLLQSPWRPKYSSPPGAEGERTGSLWRTRRRSALAPPPDSLAALRSGTPQQGQGECAWRPSGDADVSAPAISLLSSSSEDGAQAPGLHEPGSGAWEDEVSGGNRAAGLAGDEGGTIVLSSDDDGDDGAAGAEPASPASSGSSMDVQDTLSLGERLLQCSRDWVLTAEQEAAYQELCSLRGGVQVEHPVSRVVMCEEDFAKFGPGQWLGDAGINMYMSLLRDRDALRAEAQVGGPRCMVMTTNFITQLRFTVAGYRFANVARWTRRGKPMLGRYAGIADVDKVVIPVHLGSHWTCAVCNFREQRIEYYDSLHGVNEMVIQCLQSWVRDEYQDKYGGPPPERFQVENWGLACNPAGTPMQANLYDCGVFTMAACDYATLDKDFDYGQHEVGGFYRKMSAIRCFFRKLDYP